MGVTSGMRRLSRRLLFTTDANTPSVSEDDIFPREVRPPVMRTLWLSLLAGMAALIAIIVLVWWICGI
jgi:hypothetical protein